MLLSQEIIVDSFAGGGGASTGIEMALGRSPDIAINHDPEAVAMHAVNHPGSRHFCQSIYQVDPDDIAREGRPVGLAWFSPDCTHHSKARGGKPKQKHIRDLAWVVVHWAQRAKPRVIVVENVEEFEDWGPLMECGQPDPEQRGEEFKRWVHALKMAGYAVAWKPMRACDYGAPTIRKRLFLVARRDGVPITWPDATHGPGLLPFRTAAECIDFSIPCPSIFERKRPLVENTMRRIAKGVMRYVVNSADPFIVRVNHGDSGGRRAFSLDEPMTTVTQSRGDALVVPTITRIGQTGDKGAKSRGADEPLSTICTKNEHLLITPMVVGAGGPEYSGKPRAVDKPAHTFATENHSALVTAFLAQHNGGFYDGAGRAADQPLATITSIPNHLQVVASSIVKLRRNSVGGDVREPLNTITAGGGHYAEVRAFLLKYYGTDQAPELREPMHTLTARDRMGIVMVKGEPYAIIDIGMRMLTPRELYNAQGFPSDYIIDFDFKGKPLTKTAQVRMCGNSVSPPHAAALLRHLFKDAVKTKKPASARIQQKRNDDLFAEATA